MIQLTEIITANTASLVLLIMLWIQFGVKKYCVLLHEKLFMFMVKLAIVQCFWDTMVFAIDGKDFYGARFLVTMGNVVYFAINLMFAYIWPLYANYKVYGSLTMVKKQAILLAVPGVIVMIMLVTTPITGFVFTINEHNEYVRSDGLILTYVLLFFYIFFGAINFYRSKRTTGKYMIFPVVLFIFPIALAAIAQFFFYGISVTCLGLTIGLVGAYISVQSESAYIDRLSGVYSRRYLDEYLRSVRELKSDKHSVIGIMFDMDKFKQINDVFGHGEGDEAIAIVGAVLRQQLAGSGFVTRYGGDEFIIITNLDNEKEVESLLHRISSAVDDYNESGVKPYKIQYSYGHTRFMVGEESSDEFLRRMDEKMYNMKARHAEG